MVDAHAHADTPVKRAIKKRLMECKNIARPSFCRHVGQVFHRDAPPVACRLVTRIQIARNDTSRPTADARKDGYILFAVRAAIGDRLPYDSGACLELPQRI